MAAVLAPGSAAHARPGPDLVASSSGAPTATAGTRLAIKLTTRNKGDRRAARSSTRLYLSADARKGKGDRALGPATPTPALGRGTAHTTSLSATVPASTPPNRMLLLACADTTAAVRERNERNNCTARRITLTARTPANPLPAAAPNAPAPPAPAATNGKGSTTTTTTNTEPPKPTAPPEHRIGVRTAGGIGELYDRTTNTKFVPRGANYIRLASQRHSTFNVGAYDAAHAESRLAQLADMGFNTVRVFLEQTCSTACAGDPSTGRLRTAYFANVADFLHRAKAHGLRVLLTSEWLPPSSEYEATAGQARADWFAEINTLMLAPEGVDATRKLWTDIVKALRDQDAPTDTILAYEIWNEAYLNADHLPFMKSSGSVTTANGESYDMAVTADRRKIIDDGLVHLVDAVRAAIRAADPTALVTLGVFHDTEPNASRPGDPRLVRSRALIEDSTADFVDIHPYPGIGLTFAQLMQNYGIDGPTAKPVVIGEFGGFKSAYASASAALTGLLDFQRQSCSYGIDGWLLWTWDTTEQPELWTALDSSSVIGTGLSPDARPDPCA